MTNLPLLSLSTPRAFPKFPYDVPYDIQVSLMAHVYESIEQGKVAIVESPTGTVWQRHILTGFMELTYSVRRRERHLVYYVLLSAGWTMIEIVHERVN